MKKLLSGALAAGFMTCGSVLVAEKASAFSMTSCGPATSTSTITTESFSSYSSSCQQVIENTGKYNVEAAASSTLSFSSPNRINVNNVAQSLDEQTANLAKNVNSFFDIDTWTQAPDPFWDLSFSQGKTSANISPLWDLYEKVMIVFKDGSKNDLVGYLLDKTTTDNTTISWANFNPWGPNSNEAISNVRFFVSGTATPIPTPALLPGLIGMGVAAMRKKKREEELETVAQEAEA